jgi:hypothetical protein
MTHTDIHIAADDRPMVQPSATGIRWGWPVAIGALLIAAGGAGYYLWQRQAQTPVASSATAPTAPPTTAQGETGSGIEHPLEGAGAASAPLPALAESDGTMREGLSSLFGASTFDALFRPQELIRNIVATVDNLPRKSVALRLVPVKPVPGMFRVAGRDGALSISADNASRYTPYVKAMEAVDSTKLVALYVRLYPLFQQAYADLGYPSRYFNDRVFEVIDHLLATPDAPSAATLTQPKVLYEYADPALADLSAGQKLLLRMGPENESRVKAKLREIKRALSRGK